MLPPFFIFTGGPGSGKTTTLEILKKTYSVVSESGRAIIQEEIAKNGDGLPWKNKIKFRDLMLARDIELYERAKLSQITIFDRGIPDNIGYSRLEGLPVTEEIWQRVQSFPYQPNVFIFPPWKEIYVNDKERKQDFDTAVATFEAVQKAYTDLGYTIVEVPKTSAIERAEFIVNSISH